MDMEIYKDSTRNFLARFEKTKTYKFNREGLMRMEIDTKTDEIGKYMSVVIYAILGALLIKGVLGQQFIVTYIAGNIGSKTVKFIMRG